MIAAGAVDFVIVVQNSKIFLALFAGFKQHSSSAVTEEHHCRAILHIQNAGHDIGADHHDFFMMPAFDELRGGGQCIKE